MKKYSVDEVKSIIVEVALSNNEDPCLLLSMAKIESNYNNLAKSPSGTYVGLYQLSDGYGGIKGNDRLDPYKNTQGCINKIKSNRAYIKSRIGKCDDWMLYLAHQQGAGGFVYSYNNDYEKFTSAKYYSNMKGNIPRECKNTIKTTRDFLNCWKGKVENLQSNCGLDGIAKLTKQTVQFLPLLVSAVSSYFFVKYIRSKNA